MTDDRAAEVVVLQDAVDRLRAEVEGLRRAMRSRAVIEQAKGLLTERLGCTPEEAFGHLVRLSQDTNRKLVDLAAGLLGTAAPPEGEADTDTDTDTGAEVDADGPPGGFPDLGSPPTPAAPAGAPTRLDPVSRLAAVYHLVAAALADADTPDELARYLHDVAGTPLGVTAVALGLLEPDGALRLVGAHGIPPRRVSQWQRIPPETAVPLMTAAHHGTTVWESDTDATDAHRVLPGRTACAVPLRRGERIVGALGLGWDGSAGHARGATRYLDAIGRLAAGHLLRVTSPGNGEPGLAVPGGEHWFRSVIDLLYDPVLILTAVRGEGGALTDLRVEHANAATVDLAGRGDRDLAGGRLSELYPGMVTAGTFSHLLDVAATGVPYEEPAARIAEVVGGVRHTATLAVRATPFLDGVLLTWRAHDDDRGRRTEQLAEGQRLAGLGAFRWTAGDTVLGCSATALHLLGLDARGTPTPERALSRVAPRDRAAVRLLAARLLAGQRQAALEFDTLPEPGPVRTLRATAESVGGGTATGGVRAVRGVLQDVTGRRRTEQALAGTRAKLAEQRRRADAEHRAVRALQQALLDIPPAADQAGHGLDLAVRYLPAGSGPRIGGDWYDVLPLPDGRLLLAVGDVSGHGLRAAAGMARLRHALRGLAYAGTDPAETLGHLNAMVCHQDGEYIATVLCGHYAPASRTLTWARAGHLPPVLLREGRAALLERPPGPVLGAAADAGYRSERLALTPGDTLLLFTDGLLRPRGTPLSEGLARLLRVAEECPEGTDAAGCVAHLTGRLGGPDPRDDTCVLVARVG
ncbi:SpoIIE family protein phosphatase [Kitasatospora sp. NPDC004240]